MIFKVLIVDDDYINRRLLISLLKKELYQIETIESVDGEDALQKCKEHSNLQLILLDIEMPNMDGSDFLRVYKRDNPVSKVPIIAISSNDLRKKEIISFGANAFLQKPITEKKLIDAIREAQN
jgi:putative two-component system response regulator